MAELVVTTPEGAVFRYRLGRQALLGRHPDCEILLSDPMASRRHCRIEQAADGVFYAEDVGSANGTMLNNEFLRTRMPLRVNDVLQIGSTRLVLQLEAGEPTALERPRPQLDPDVSIVQLREDVAEAPVSFDYATTAEVQPVTEAQVAAADLGELKRVTQRLRLLVDLGQSLTSTLRPRQLLSNCLDKLFEVFPQAERSFILLLDPEGEPPAMITTGQEVDDALGERSGPLSVSKIRNPQPGEENQVQVSRTVINRVRTQRQAVLLSDASGSGASLPAVSLLRLEIRSVMCAPLIAGGQTLGLLYLDTKDARRPFGPDDVNLLTSVASQIAVVIRNMELAREVAAEAASRQNLQRFFSPHLVERIMRKEITVEPGGTTTTGTVFFSDLVSFTRIAGQMRAGDVVTMLNRYFRVMQEIIFARGGTVDKFGGDLIMAFWGVLVDMPQATAAAAAAALEMQNAMFAFNRELAYASDLVRPPEPLGHGIGLNTGEFMAGIVGSERKIEFTVIGSTVNLAERLQQLAGRGRVYIGQGTYGEIKERALVFRLPDSMVKNVPDPVQVYSLRGLAPPARPEAGGPAADGGGRTSRLDSSSAEILYSLPCVLEAEGCAPVRGVVTRMALTRSERRGRLRLLADAPLPTGARVHLRWCLPEKPSLSALDGVVEHSWGSEADGRPTAVTSTEAVLGTLEVYATGIPDDVLKFRLGVELPSDLTRQDQIIRD